MEQMGQEKKKEELVREYLSGEKTYREMEKRHGVAASTIHRWVKEYEKGPGPEVRRALAVEESELSSDVRQLRKELEEARLYNKLLNTMIDIAEEQMGADIRKKRGAK
jgi:transposase-like protein